MVLKNHIAYRFLTDDTLAMEILEVKYPDIYKKLAFNAPLTELERAKNAALFRLVSKDNQKAFLVTNTVVDKLEMLHVKRQADGKYDWKVFNHLQNIKYTFVLPPSQTGMQGCCLRMLKEKDVIEFCHLEFSLKPGEKENGQALWVMFWVDTTNNLECEHFKHQDVTAIEEFVYKLLCFVFLSENFEEVLKPGEKKGTRKQGKIINSLPIPLTIINSKWNITSIRTDGFGVKGHFAIRWTGEGRKLAKMVWINPFEKRGYVRKATNTDYIK